MAKKMTKKQNVKNWKKGLGTKAINTYANNGNGMRKGLILT